MSCLILCRQKLFTTYDNHDTALRNIERVLYNLHQLSVVGSTFLILLEALFINSEDKHNTIKFNINQVYNLVRNFRHYNYSAFYSDDSINNFSFQNSWNWLGSCLAGFWQVKLTVSFWDIAVGPANYFISSVVQNKYLCKQCRCRKIEPAHQDLQWLPGLSCILTYIFICNTGHVIILQWTILSISDFKKLDTLREFAQGR